MRRGGAGWGPAGCPAWGKARAPCCSTVEARTPANGMALAIVVARSRPHGQAGHGQTKEETTDECPACDALSGRRPVGWPAVPGPLGAPAAPTDRRRGGAGDRPQADPRWPGRCPGRGRRGAGCGGGPVGLGRSAAARARQGVPPCRHAVRAAFRRTRPGHCAGDRRGPVQGRARGARGDHAVPRGGRHAAGGAGPGAGQPGRPAELRAPGAVRRGRRDLAVQLSAVPDAALGGAGAGGRQRGGGQAGCAHAGVRRLPDRARVCRSGSAGGAAARAAGRRRGGRWWCMRACR